jgi:hypothetical protein
VIESTTRAIRPRTLLSRSGVPIWPRKYLLATMFVAVWLQVDGVSMLCCSKTGRPRSSLMTADRISHVTSSNGCTPALVKYLWYVRPWGAAFLAASASVFARPLGLLLFSTGWVDM